MKYEVFDFVVNIKLLSIYLRPHIDLLRASRVVPRIRCRDTIVRFTTTAIRR